MTTTLPPPASLPPTASPLRRALALFAKELSHNLVTIAILLGLAAAVAVIATLFQWEFQGGYATSSTDAFTIFFLTATQITIAITLPAIGLLLGLAQIRGETSAEMWAFLIHRPAGRTALFAARALAGLLLYAIVAGIPLALLILYAATPDGGEFFSGVFLLPALADFASGLVYYLAGMLVAQSTATMLGPRALPLLLAIACSVVIHVLPSFTLSILVIAAAAAVCLVAAAGSFHSNGFRLRAPALAHAAWTILITASLISVLYPALLSLQSLLDTHEQDRLNTLQRTLINSAPPLTTPLVITRRVQRPDGTIIDHIYTYLPGGRGAPGKTTDSHYQTLDGHPLPDNTPNLDNPEVATSYLSTSYPTPQRPRSYRDLESLLTENDSAYEGPQGKPIPERCFYLVDEGRYYLYAQQKPYPLLGTIGKNGFTPPGQLAEPFAVPLLSYPFYDDLITPQAIYNVDLYHRKVTQLFATPPRETIQAVMIPGSRWPASQATTAPSFPAVPSLGVQGFVTDKHFLLFSQSGSGAFPELSRPDATIRAGHPLVSLPITHSLADFSAQVEYLPDAKRWSAWYKHSYVADGTSRSESFVDLYDFSGALISETPLDWLNRVEPPFATAVPPQAASILRQRQAYAGLLGGATLPLVATMTRKPPTPEFDLHITWIYLLFSFATAAAITLLTIPLIRRYRHPIPWSLAWLLATFLLGPAIPLTFLATHSLPRRQKCPTCRKRRPLPADLCPHCHSPWPAPPRTGTEILT